MAVVRFSMEQANQAMDTIFRTLQQGESGSGGLVVAEVIKAGSLGHGTAVPGHYDLDIVIYSDSLDDRQLSEKKGYLDTWLDMVQRFLDRKLPASITEKKRTAHSFQFKYNDKLDVDLLVSPFWRDKQDLYRFLNTVQENKRQMFSMSASKWQVDFFRHQPEQVKEFIKRAKAWRNVTWGRTYEGKPKSYLISVIVLRAWENANKKGDTSTRGMAKNTTDEVKKIVKGNATANIYWEENYKVSDYVDLFPPRCPRIVDPALPSNNLHISGIADIRNTRPYDYGEGGGRWGYFVQYVDSLDLTKTVEEIQRY